MKVLKRMLAVLLTASLLMTLAGCYLISGQKMKTVKGTYKLTNYTYIPKHEQGKTPNTVNYLEDEEYLYEEYLIVTGEGRGYYVHKDANTPAYVKEVTLSYRYSAEDSSRVEYVIFNDALTVNSESGKNRLGVNKNTLGYSLPAIDYTELITKRKMRSEDMSVRWEKVDRATDLSYVEEQLGTLKRYDYSSFGKRGIYEIGAPINIETGEVMASEYRYFLIVIDPATNATTATAHYARTETPTVPETASVTITHTGDWATVVLDGATYTLEPEFGNYYMHESGGARKTLRKVASDLTDDMLAALIESRIPALSD